MCWKVQRLVKKSFMELIDRADRNRDRDQSNLLFIDQKKLFVSEIIVQ